jgi:dihydrofolate reductase
MHPIIYDVAVSADGFIAGSGGDVAAFPHDGAVVVDYQACLATYAHVLMGRGTYEFGYRFGLPPGANPYPHAGAIVVSRTLALPPDTAVGLWRDMPRAAIADLKFRATGPIYLCGGGQLAAALLAMGQIDRLRLKRAPILLGGGTPLFSSGTPAPRLTLKAQTDYGEGLIYQDFAVTCPPEPAPKL